MAAEKHYSCAKSFVHVAKNMLVIDRAYLMANVMVSVVLIY